MAMKCGSFLSQVMSHHLQPGMEHTPYKRGVRNTFTIHPLKFQALPKSEQSETEPFPLTLGVFSGLYATTFLTALSATAVSTALPATAVSTASSATAVSTIFSFFVWPASSDWPKRVREKQ